MQISNFKHLWLLLVSITWLIGTALLFEKYEMANSSAYANVASPSSTSVHVIDEGHILYFFKGCLNWLSLFADRNVEQSDLSIPEWPERSQLKSLFSIISFQQYQSAIPQNS